MIRFKHFKRPRKFTNPIIDSFFPPDQHLAPNLERTICVEYFKAYWTLISAIICSISLRAEFDISARLTNLA